MTRVVRAAMTQTINAFRDMPDSPEALESLVDRVDDIRTANLEHHAALIRKAHAQGAKVIGLGELFTGPYFALEAREFWRGLAEDALTGPSSLFMCSLARELGIVIIAPIYELHRASDKRYNTALMIDADGTLLGGYRKTHIPCGSNERASFSETFYYGASDGSLLLQEHQEKLCSKNPFFPVWKTAAGRIGVAICYDRHFEDATRTLAENHAEIIFSPAVTFGEKSRRMWDLEFPTDACRHNLFIGGSNRRGNETPWNVEYFGASYFVGPQGRLENLSKDPELIISDLDLNSLHCEDPSGWNLKRDIRPEIYQKTP